MAPVNPPSTDYLGMSRTVRIQTYVLGYAYAVALAGGGLMGLIRRGSLISFLCVSPSLPSHLGALIEYFDRVT